MAITTSKLDINSPDSLQSVTETRPRNNKMTKKGILLTWTGFTRKRILVLSILTVGYFSFFCAVHLMYLLPNGKWDTPLVNGERFWVLKEGLGYWLNQIHLWSVIPAGIFLPLQFLPAMRRRYVTAHRIAGRVLFMLLGLGSMTGLKMSMTAFGGTPHTKLYGTVLALSCTLGTYKSLVSIKKLQIDQHRIWVLRTWSYAGSILSLRMFLLPTILTFAIFSLHPTSSLNCAQISFVCHEKFKYNETLLHQEIAFMNLRYPACLNLTKPAIETIVPVEARMRFHGRHPEQATVLYNMIFGACGLTGLLLNAVAVEIYIRMTGDETERLKKVGAMRRKAVDRENASKEVKRRFEHVVEKDPQAVDQILRDIELPQLQGNAWQRKGMGP